jgi:hypothetical protein
MAATVRLVVTALNKASVKSAQCVKLLPKRKPRASPASLTLPLNQALPQPATLHQHLLRRHPLLRQLHKLPLLLRLLHQWPFRRRFRHPHRFKW